MCGIFGMLAPEADNDWVAAVTQRLFKFMEERGTDSSGIAYFNEEGRTFILKKPIKGSAFQNDEELLELLYARDQGPPKVFIAHCRKLSSASANDNNNNHPIPGRQTGMALVHNGRVQDFIWRATDDEDKNPFMLGDFEAEVDSEAIMRLVETLLFIPGRADDEFGTIDSAVVEKTPKEEWPKERQVTVLKAVDDATFNLTGKNTCAILDPADTNALHIWRVENPLYAAWVPSQKAFIFSSTKAILEKGLAEEKVEWLFDFIEMSREKTSPEFHGMEIQDDFALRVEWTGEKDNELEFTTLNLNPDAADFSTVAEDSRDVSANSQGDVTVQ